MARLSTSFGTRCVDMSAVPVASDATGKGASAGFLGQTEFGHLRTVAIDCFGVAHLTFLGPGGCHHELDPARPSSTDTTPMRTFVMC